MFRYFCKHLVKLSTIKRCMYTKPSARPRTQPGEKVPMFYVGRYILLLCPAACLGLTVWQIQRYKWKINLIETTKLQSTMDPLPLPQDLSELDDLDLYPIKVRGHFDYTNEVYLGPRSDTGSKGFKIPSYHVITPFVLADRDLTILLNRGWYSEAQLVSRDVRENGKIHGEVEITGLVRHDQVGYYVYKYFSGADLPKIKDDCEIYLVRKIDMLAERCLTAEIYLDSQTEKLNENSPNPVKVGSELRNNHRIYVLTWATLGILTFRMWWKSYNLPMRSGVNAFIRKQEASRNSGNEKS